MKILWQFVVLIYYYYYINKFNGWYYPQKKGEERKCNSGDWTTLKPKHSLSPHINIKKKKTEISKKIGTNGNTLKKIKKKKKKKTKKQTKANTWVYAHQRPKLRLKYLYSISSFDLLNGDFFLFQNKAHWFGLEKRQTWLNQTKAL